MRKTIILLLGLLCATFIQAQNWDMIRSSGEYYYGVGEADNEQKATEMAIAEMNNMIVMTVAHEFENRTDETEKNGETDYKSRAMSYVRTYSQATLTNVEKWVTGEEPNITVRCYMKRSEMKRIYNERIIKAKDMLNIAEQAKSRSKIDMALQYYYWAYSLIRSVQHPNEVKDEEGKVLVNRIPLDIDDILSRIKVDYEKRDGDFVDLLVSYNGQPISSLEYTYSDGRSECHGAAKDGRGVMEMAPGYQTKVYHMNVEYQYMGQARGDAEMFSVLEAVPRKMFPHAEITVVGKSTPHESKPELVHTSTAITQPKQETATAYEDFKDYADILNKVIEAIRTKSFLQVTNLFTFNGLDIYDSLIAYGKGKGRIVGTPELRFHRGLNGVVSARGLQMSFSFWNGKQKKTFVEDIVFTFNQEKKIDCIAFGLGKIATNDILGKYAPGWNNETKEMLMEFLENYKTAYSLKRLDYIRSIFADDAVIIVGNVVRRRANPTLTDGPQMSMSGTEKIKYNRYDKDQYLDKLDKCFKRNEFINIKFSQNDVQRLEKFKKENLFAIQIGQEYASTSYSDKGYLFLLVDMTKREEPLIRIRTWQPNEVDMEKLYSAGDFYDE